MGVDFSARIILGYRVSREEFGNLKNNFDDRTIDNFYDNYMLNSDSYDENSDLFFTVDSIVYTEDWEEFDMPNIDELMKNEQECINKFYEMFPDRNTEKPKLYLIEEVW